MEHTVKAYHNELSELGADVQRLGQLAADQLRAALDLVVDHSAAKATPVIAADAELDALALEIERKAIRLIALRQPMADDLRRAVAALKSSVDLERCGDLAKSIAKRAAPLEEDIPEPALHLIKELGELVLSRLKEVVQAYADGDVERARAVWSNDVAVDELHERLVDTLLARMGGEPRFATAGVQLLFVGKNLERIGDHATNIAELVCYEATGTSLGESRPKL
jgi:phosphate transport system protein